MSYTALFCQQRCANITTTMEITILESIFKFKIEEPNPAPTLRVLLCCNLDDSEKVDFISNEVWTMSKADANV